MGGCTVDEQVAAGAREMLEYLREHGWCKGKMELTTGQACLRGARRCTGGEIGTAGLRTSMTIDLYSAMILIIQAEFPGRIDPESGVFSHVAEFNDHPETTWADLEMVLEKVAAGA
jgi:hypothetical protein